GGGLVLAGARHGRYLVGYASGMPLRPSTAWWRDLTAPLPAEVTAEHPGRTFALADLVVRASWRRQGIARALHDLLLAGRPEERATLTVLPAAAPAQHAFRAWGWRKVARTRHPRPGSPVCDVLLTTLPLDRTIRRLPGPDLSTAGASAAWLPGLGHAPADFHRATAGRRLRHAAVGRPGHRAARLRCVLPFRPLSDH